MTQINNVKLKKLQKLLRNVLETNEFYKNKYQNVGITTNKNIRTWESFFSLPTTSRQELARDQMQHPPFGTNITQPLKEYIYTIRSSGTTTGQPLFQPFTIKEFNRYVDVLEMGNRLLNIERNDIFCHLTPNYYYPFSLAATKKIGALSVPAEEGNLISLLQTLKKMRVTVFQSYPFVISQLIELARDQNVDLKSLNVRKLITIGETGGGDPTTKKFFEETWNAKVTDHIGSTEGATYGILCPKSYSYHLIDKDFIYEVLDPKTGKHCQKGELVITFLWRHDYPLIRYRTGDIVEMKRGHCVCGQKTAHLIAGILGRVDSLTKIRAKFVYPEDIERVIRSYSEVQEFEIVVRRIKGIDMLNLYIELPIGTKYPYVAIIIKELEDLLGLSPKIFPLLPKMLPRPGFKKAKRFYDERIGNKHTISMRKKLFSILYMKALYLNLWINKLSKLLFIKKESLKA